MGGQSFVIGWPTQTESLMDSYVSLLLWSSNWGGRGGSSVLNSVISIKKCSLHNDTGIKSHHIMLQFSSCNLYQNVRSCHDKGKFNKITQNAIWFCNFLRKNSHTSYHNKIICIQQCALSLTVTRLTLIAWYVKIIMGYHC